MSKETDKPMSIIGKIAMKLILKFSIYFLLLLFSISCNKTSQESNNELKLKDEYVDLGLPSGTLWKTKESYIWYNWNDAMFEFWENLPTREQFIELQTFCTWEWTANGYKVIGDNGNYIILHARGYYNCVGDLRSLLYLGGYWSNTDDGSEKAYILFFNSDRVQIRSALRCYSLSVCLVKD